ncbi:hypothetical protein [Rhizobium sp. SAFR-030]|uniref:hypothetical protein n=1 Tax=Rhizobium sp. SAFR-030 TaxID=3387277 RepID=UPI003F7F9B44
MSQTITVDGPVFIMPVLKKVVRTDDRQDDVMAPGAAGVSHDGYVVFSWNMASQAWEQERAFEGSEADLANAFADARRHALLKIWDE